MQSLGATLRKAGLAPRQKDYSRPEEGPECDVCRDTGWVQRRARLGERGFGQLRPCRCRPVAGPTFDEFRVKRKDKSVKAALEATRGWVAGEGPGILVLTGGVGLGKTHLARAAYRALCLMEDPDDARWFTDGSLLDAIHRSFRDGSYESLMGDLERLPWMVLDDFGVSALSDTMLGAVERIVDLRWQGAEVGRRTLVTTNLGKFSDRVASRLRDRARARSVHITGEDHRRERR